MTQDKTGGPAFPGETVVRAGMHGTKRVNNSGMTLRDWFAGQYIAGAFGGEPGSHLRIERAAVDAYALADAMIAARNGGQDT